MKTRTERGLLTDALTWVTRAVPRNPPAPVLAGVRLTASDGVLTVSAFDLETAHTAAVVSEVAGDGERLVSGLFLRDAVAGGRGSEVELVLDGDLLTVTSGRSVYRLRTMLLGDYPSLPPFPPVVGVVNPDALRDALAAVIPAVDDQSSVDKARGVHIEGGDLLDIVGTDIYRLHHTTLPWDAEHPFEATVPARVLGPAAKVMDAAVEIAYEDGLLGLSDGTHQVTMRCYATRYAEWSRVIEQGQRSQVDHFTIDGGDLAGAVKQVGSMAPFAPLILDYTDGEVSVTVDAETGDGCEVLPATGDGPAFRASVNARYMGDLLAACRPGPVDVHYAAGTVAPLTVVDPQQPHLTLILMTKRLTGGTT
jgi:DNA polymerase-3 subunit beta